MFQDFFWRELNVKYYDTYETKHIFQQGTKTPNANGFL